MGSFFFKHNHAQIKTTRLNEMFIQTFSLKNTNKAFQGLFRFSFLHSCTSPKLHKNVKKSI